MLKSLLFNRGNFHFFAFFSASLVHCSLLVWGLMPSKPIVINQQAIQISFVAPSGANKKNDSISHKKIVVGEQKNFIKHKHNNHWQNNQTAKTDIEESLLAGKQSSGLQDPNAVAVNSAQSDPVFNAAYLNNPAPSYPIIARRNGVQGKVLVNVLVKTDGTPAEVVVFRSSGSVDLDMAAIDAVRRWKFIPAHRGDESVQANVTVPVEFKII